MKTPLHRWVFFKRPCTYFSLKSFFKLFLFYLTLFQSPFVLGQNGWKLGLGNSNTQYKYLNSKGLPITFLKQGSGNSIFISAESTLLDSSSILGQTTERAVYQLR
jgi:hypothetical protein